MEYNFDRVPNRRLPGVLNKWTWFPKDVLPMWIADMDFSAPAPILQALCKYAEHGDLGYSLPSTKLYETVAARMAFKEAYARRVSEAREQRIPVKWTASLGHDKNGRETVLMDAMEEGRLTVNQVSALLP